MAAERGAPRVSDAVALLVLLASFFVANNVSDWINAPYWHDETWVALSIRVPLGDLPQITSSTPIGWSLLLRLIPDPDALRLVPLAFSLIALLAAYTLGRLLPWRNRAESVLAGLVCAGAVVLLPAQQLRHDLKQYTADAAVTLGYLVMVTWLERTWSRRRLAVVVATVPVAFLLSQLTVIAVAVTFAGLVCSAALRRDLRRLAEVAVAGGLSLAVIATMYLVLVVPNRSSALMNYWSDRFPAAADLPAYLHARLNALDPALGSHHLPVTLVLLGAGVVVLAVQRRAATLVAFLTIPVLAVALGVARMYPLLDLRTSFFMFPAAAAVAGLGVAGGAFGLARVVLREPPQTWRTLLAAVLVSAALACYAVSNRAWYRFDGVDPRLPNYSPIAISDVRTQTRWVNEHSTPADVVIVSVMATFGYVFYDGAEPMTWKRAADNTVGWVPMPPAGGNVIFVQGSTLAPILDAVNHAVAKSRQNGANARVLLVRTWWGGEADAWRAALKPYVVTHPYAGTEPVAVIANP